MIIVIGTVSLQKGNSDSSLQAHSTGEESNSSDTNLSDRGPMTDLCHLKSEPSDYSPNNDEHPTHSGSNHLDPSRTPSFPAALLGLQGKTLFRLMIGTTRKTRLCTNIISCIFDRTSWFAAWAFWNACGQSGSQLW